MKDARLEMRPLGLLAMGAAILSAAMSVTYFFSPIALGVAVVALLLGGASRTDPMTRRMGHAAIFLAVVAIVVACAMIVFFEPFA